MHTKLLEILNETTAENEIEWISNVLLVATVAKVPNISLFIQLSCLPESIRNPLASLKSATSSVRFNDLINLLRKALLLMYVCLIKRHALISC